jgi:hypothetical protein
LSEDGFLDVKGLINKFLESRVAGKVPVLYFTDTTLDQDLSPFRASSALSHWGLRTPVGAHGQINRRLSIQSGISEKLPFEPGRNSMQGDLQGRIHGARPSRNNGDVSLQVI